VEGVPVFAQFPSGKRAKLRGQPVKEYRSSDRNFGHDCCADQWIFGSAESCCSGIESTLLASVNDNPDRSRATVNVVCPYGEDERTPDLITTGNCHSLKKVEAFPDSGQPVKEHHRDSTSQYRFLNPSRWICGRWEVNASG